MATAYKQQRLTVDEFLDLYTPLREKYELVDGIPVMMAGGSRAHALTAANIIIALGAKLRGTGCRPVGSDAVLKVGDLDTRLPDAAIYCDRRDLDPLGGDDGKTFAHPRVLFEVLSPSTAREDRGAKLAQYQAIESVQTIVFVDPDRQTFEVYDRVSAREWRDIKQGPGEDLVLRDPAVTLTAAEVFD